MRQRSTRSDSAAGQLVEVQTRFHHYAVQPGGVSRAAALHEAGEVLKFARDELDQRVFGAFNELIALVGAGGHSLPAMREQARELRDLGQLAGFPVVTAVAAMLADYLSGCIDRKMAFRSDVVTCYVDSLKVFCSPQKRGLSTLEFPGLLDELREMQDRLLPES